MEVGRQVRVELGHVVGDGPRAQGPGGQHPGGDRLPGGDRGGVGDPAVAHEAQELIDGELVGAVVPGALLGDDVLLGGALGVVLGTLGPHLDDVSGTVAEVLAARDTADASVALYGYEKDASSYYLRLFPQWGYLGAPRYRELSATPLRERYFLLKDGEDWHEAELPPAVEAALRAFRSTPDYRRLAAETRYVCDYKASWAASPYPPIFVTVDNLITCDGHILLVERGGQPGCGLLALPGGFLNPDENLRDACLRELREETGLQLPRDAISRVRTADRPDRSAIGRVITHVHRYHLDGTLPPVQAADDAAKAYWHPLDDLRRDRFHEDHYHLIRDGLAEER